MLPPSATSAVAGIFGLVVGSFLNVVIWRVPRRESIVSPPSACPGCGKRIGARDNIPVISWMVLKGRCRQCGVRISARYPIVELAGGVLFAGAGLRFGWHPETVAYCVFLAALVVLSGIDLDHRVLPSRVIYPSGLVVAVLLLWASIVGSSWRPMVDAVTGCGLGFGLLLLIHLVQPRGMGFGDVRLAGLIGLGVGWLGLAHVAVALFAGFLLGALLGGVLMMTGRAGRRTAIPFGPFLAGGAVIAVFWGSPIVRLWLH